MHSKYFALGRSAAKITPGPLQPPHPWAKFGGGHGGRVPPLFQTGRTYYAMSPHFFLFAFCIWSGFENKSDVCHVLCEEVFMLDERQYIIAKLMLK